MRKIKNKNMMVLVVIFIVTLTSSIGYSALQSNLKVTADLNVLKDYIPDGTLYDMMHHISEMDNTSSKYVSSPSGIDFSQISSDTNGKGVYELHTTATEKYPIHYYRGEVDNNVIFANFCWKIIRTTETGGVKLIYDGKPSADGKCNNTGTDASIGASPYNSSYEEAKYAGYKYDNDEVDSIIKKKVDNWYKENIEDKYSNYLEDTIFCVDRSSRMSGNDIYYGAYDRNRNNKKPSLKCPQDSDKFTVANGKLTYPVGLITADEVVYAGGVWGIENNIYHLYTGEWYWTMTPSNSENGTTRVLDVANTGLLINSHVVFSPTIRPVVSLKHDTRYLSGNGSKDTPYLITPITRSLYNVIKSKSVLDNVKSEYVESETGIDFSQISSDTNGKGIYELHTTASDKYPVYYYRGAVTDNNIIFANFCWKIIRTTETGGVKIIYNGSPTSDDKCTNTAGSKTQIGASAYNENYDEAKYVGYKYDNDEVDSTIKTKIDNWYEENIESKYSNHLEDTTFCNDRSISRQSESIISYGPLSRNYSSKTPSLVCPREEDKFTVANKKLTYPVGLITIDEVSYAGGVCNVDNSMYYLYTNQWYWSMSPFNFNATEARAWNVDLKGYLDDARVHNYSGGIRPVISLKINIQVTGIGTSNNPYIVAQ